MAGSPTASVALLEGRLLDHGGPEPAEVVDGRADCQRRLDVQLVRARHHGKSRAVGRGRAVDGDDHPDALREPVALVGQVAAGRVVELRGLVWRRQRHSAGEKTVSALSGLPKRTPEVCVWGGEGWAVVESSVALGRSGRMPGAAAAGRLGWPGVRASSGRPRPEGTRPPRTQAEEDSPRPSGRPGTG